MVRILFLEFNVLARVLWAGLQSVIKIIVADKDISITY